MDTMKIANKQLMLAVLCSSLLVGTAQADSTEHFVVRDIKITGLQRVKLGTVLNYLPVQVGEDVGPASTASIIRALYDTGFFQSVVLERQDNTLIVQVVERATIGSITVVGNKEIPDDKMKEILKELGLVKGRVYQRAAVERFEKELKQAYNARGKYNARVESSASDLTDNRVAVKIIISEGVFRGLKRLN